MPKSHISGWTPSVLFVWAAIIVLCGGCSSSGFIRHKSKKFIRQDFPERFFIDTVTNTAFSKVYGFRWIGKRDFTRLKKTDFFQQFSINSDHLMPVYVATKQTAERLPEYILIFKVKHELPISGYLSAHFQKIDLYRHLGFYQFNKKRSVQTYYSHDPIGKWIASFAFVRTNANDMPFLVVGFLPYSNASMIIEEPLRASGNLYKTGNIDYSATYNYGLNKYGSDTILQTRSFWNTVHIISSIKSADQFVYHDYFKVAGNAFIKNRSISYHEPVNILRTWDQNELERSDDIYSYSYYKRSLSTYSSFLGLHKKAVEDSSIKGVSSPEGYSIVSADQYILNRIAGRRIIVFNELGFDVRNRAFLFHLLDSLKKREFTHLAIEDLNKKFRVNRIHAGSGLYIREPVLHNLVDYANSIGLKVIAYDFCSDCLSGERNKAAAKELLNRVQLKRHKLIVLCGIGNIGKSKKGAAPATLVDYLQYYSRYEPFTIAQAMERWFYLKDVMIDHYYILRSDLNNQSYHPMHSSADVSVFPPTTMPYFDYEFYDQKGLLPLNKCTFQYTPVDSGTKKEVTLYLYKHTKRNGNNKALPLFVKQLENRSQQVNIYSSNKGKARLEVRDAANELLSTKEIVLQQR